MDKQIRRHLRDYFFGVMSTSNFESWLYADKVAENQLGKTIYFDLIDSDYSSESGRDITREKIVDVYPRGLEGLRRDYSRDIARDGREGKLDLETACRALADLECSGATSIPATFDFLVDAIDRGTDPESLKDDIIQALDELLLSLGDESSEEEDALRSLELHGKRIR